MRPGLRWRHRLGTYCLSGALLLAANFSYATITVIDDGGNTLSLPTSAKRIISLAPHTTELLFAAGAGKNILGVSSFSDFPPEASRITSVGSSTQLDIERIVSLRPDLVVAWKSGNSARQIARLRQLGITVFESEPQTLDQIASSIERLAALTGTEEAASAAAALFRQQLNSLRTQYQQRSSVSVFYQVWSKPLMTLNGSHLVSQVLHMCGGKNSFAQLPQIAPTITTESVVRANPEVIFVSDESTDTIKRWLQFVNLTAVKRNNIFKINSTLMNRAGPRILSGAKQLCENLEQARLHRPH
jgi:iron complex transport system substrate-binding protein